MSTITVWLLVSITVQGAPVILAEFENSFDCQHVKSEFDKLTRRVQTTCINAKVLKR